MLIAFGIIDKYKKIDLDFYHLNDKNDLIPLARNRNDEAD